MVQFLKSLLYQAIPRVLWLEHKEKSWSDRDSWEAQNSPFLEMRRRHRRNKPNSLMLVDVLHWGLLANQNPSLLHLSCWSCSHKMFFQGWKKLWFSSPWREWVVKLNQLWIQILIVLWSVMWKIHQRESEYYHFPAKGRGLQIEAANTHSVCVMGQEGMAFKCYQLTSLGKILTICLRRW